MSDLEADPLVMFQHKHYLPCFLLAGFVLPTLLPHLVWGESLATAYFMAVVRCYFQLSKSMPRPPFLVLPALPQVCGRPPLHLAGQLCRPPLRDEALRQDHRALGEQVLKTATSLPVPAFTHAPLQTGVSAGHG